MNKEFLYITTIAHHLSISKAAQELYISQPSLSHYLSTVEERIGTQLFIRSTKGLTLTFTGEEYCKMANEVLSIYGDFENGITELNELKKGRVRVGITNYLGVLELPKILPLFYKKYPNIQIELYEHNSMTLEEMVSQNKLDFALMHTSKQLEIYTNASIEIETLNQDPIVVVTKQNSALSSYGQNHGDFCYPTISPEYLVHQRFIMLKRGQMIRQITTNILSKANVKPNILLETINFETARRLSSSGIGITLAPLSYCSIYQGRYDCDYFLLPPEYEAHWDLSIVTPKNTHLSRATKELIGYFKKQLSS